MPSEVMPASLRTGYCLTLKSAGLAAKLPFSQAPLMGENERKCFVPCVQEDKRFPSEGNSKEGRKMKGNALSPAGRGDRLFPLEGHWKERGKIAIE